MSLSLYSSYTLSRQVQTGPLKSSGLVGFQIDRRVLAGPPQICFSSAEKMERLLFFSRLLRVMNDTLSLRAQFRLSSDLIWTNANSEVGMFYQVT